VIKLSQPKSKSDTKAKQNVVVSIDINKQFYVGQTRVSIDSLRSALLPAIQKEKTEIPTVVINADKNVPIDDVVAVMRVARDLGARTVLSVDKN
jgi:biopolymer transport protein ExbD